MTTNDKRSKETQKESKLLFSISPPGKKFFLFVLLVVVVVVVCSPSTLLCVFWGVKNQ